jgi:hypothetical protein
MQKIVFTCLLPSVIILLGFYFTFRTELLRDSVSNRKSKYKTIAFSFARTQLFWWSIIISVCASVYYGEHSGAIDLPFEYVILLGISLGTTAFAKVMDNTDMNVDRARHQQLESEGFLMDILSDENGISVHRFQALAFNLIFGLSVLFHFFNNDEEFLPLGEVHLALMGISSAAYLGLKVNENTSGKKNKDGAANATPHPDGSAG